MEEDESEDVSPETTTTSSPSRKKGFKRAVAEKFAEKKKETGGSIAGATLEGYTWLLVFLRIVLIAFPTAFLLGGGNWQSWYFWVFYEMFVGVFLFVLLGYWIWATFVNKRLLELGYKGNGENSLVERRKMERHRSLNLLFFASFLEYAIDTISQHSYFRKYVEKGSAANPGGATAPINYQQNSDTPNPGGLEYWRFYLLEGTIIYLNMLVLVLTIGFLFRIRDNRVDPAGSEGQTRTVANSPFRPGSMYGISGYVLYVAGAVYCFLFMIAFAGTRDNINTTGLFSVLLVIWLAWFANVWGFYRLGASKNLSRDLFYRSIQKHLTWFFMLAFNSIFALYVLVNTPGNTYNNGKAPRFDATLSAVGQTNYFYFWTIMSVLNAAFLFNPIVSFVCHTYSCTRDDVEWSNEEVIAPFRKWYVWMLKYAALLIAVIYLSFFAYDFYDGHFLNLHFKNWTIYSTLVLGIIALPLIFVAHLLYQGERSLLDPQYLYPTVVVIPYWVVIMFQYLWANVYYEEKYESLGHSQSNIDIGDTSHPLSVYWWAYLYFMMLIFVPAILGAVDFVSHTGYQIKVRTDAFPF